jgi:hypothetical protein
MGFGLTKGKGAKDAKVANFFVISLFDSSLPAGQSSVDSPPTQGCPASSTHCAQWMQSIGVSASPHKGLHLKSLT